MIRKIAACGLIFVAVLGVEVAANVNGLASHLLALVRSVL